METAQSALTVDITCEHKRVTAGAWVFWEEMCALNKSSVKLTSIWTVAKSERDSSGDDGSAKSYSAGLGARTDGATAIADGEGAGPAASPTGTCARANGNRKLTVTGGGSSVTFCVVTNLLEVPTTKEHFHQKGLAHYENGPMRDHVEMFRIW